MVIPAEVETRMLEKSFADAVELIRQEDGTFLTRSARTKPGVFYITTVDTCTCPAVSHCKHIARVREALKPKCPICNGAGFFHWTTSISTTCQVTNRIPCSCHPAEENPWKWAS